ncbi:MAG: hypothetical protein OXG49_01085 [Chloroflexi bacterium]|nr:hypothetical protein [Chloroflexota bacterium]
MSKVLRLKGIIHDIDYEPKVRTKALEPFAFERFDINAAAGSGILEFADDTSFGFSKWKSPKPSRSYPSKDIYRIYHLQTKRVTVIPVIKDEGNDTPNNDRITSMTLARMNLTDVYIVLAWYDHADPNTERGGDRITGQLLNNEFVVDRMREIKRAQKSALHWNTMHFERDFEYVYRQAVESYRRIGEQCNVEMHSTEKHLAILEQYLADGQFNLEAFARYSSARSAAAAKREAMTTHDLEQLTDGDKAYFELVNLQGGKYHLTVDEVFWEDGRLVVQESKNAPKDKMPGLGVIQDGLFKNILFYSIDELYLDSQRIEFVTRLKLTGNISGELMLPDDGEAAIGPFADSNNLTSTNRCLLKYLYEEVTINPGFTIEIAPNS